MVYQISLYSEPLFTFLELISLFILGRDPNTFQVLLSAFVIGLSTATRSTGSLCTIVPLFFMIHKIWNNLFGPPKSGIFKKIVSFAFGISYFVVSALLILIAGIIPIITITIWKPYENYCLSRLDTSIEVPSWCFDEIPNVYNYIQQKFWDVEIGGFLKRPWYLTAVSLFTNQLFLLMLMRSVFGHGILSFFTGGLFKSGK